MISQVTLDLELLRVAHTALHEERLFARAEARPSRKVLGRIRVGTAVLPIVVEPGGFHHQQLGGFQIHPVCCRRMVSRNR